MADGSTEARTLDLERLNHIGEWIAQAHANERVVMCLHLRALYGLMKTAFEERSKAAGDDAKVEAGVAMMTEVLDALFAAIQGLENGDHINPSSCETYYLFQIELAGQLRTFGLPPNEAAMATDPSCTPRAWTAEPLA